MTTTYRPRGMPRRFMAGAPEIVRREIVDILAVKPAAPLDFDVILRHVEGEGCRAQMAGLDFGDAGERGCHFFMHPVDMAAYRGRKRRHRVAWNDLPEKTQRAIVAYLESE